MNINVINKSKNPLPKYADSGCSGADVYADIEHINKKFLYGGAEITVDPETWKDNILIIPPMGRALIPSGIHVDIPKGYEIQVRCRSGLALKQGIMVTNGVGTVDESFKGDIGIILTNTGNNPFIVRQGDRIAQLVLMPVTKIEWNLVDSLEESERGEGGFGHSGIS